MNRLKVKHNDVKKVGNSCEDFSSGRVSVEEQRSPGRQSATVQKSMIILLKQVVEDVENKNKNGQKRKEWF